MLNLLEEGQPVPTVNALMLNLFGTPLPHLDKQDGLLQKQPSQLTRRLALA